MGRPSLPSARSPEWALLVLTGAALVVRLAFLFLEPSTRPVADETTWTGWAVENLASARVSFSPFRNRMIFYPPLYPYFLAVPYALAGSLKAAKILQMVVSALLVPAVGRVGSLVFGPRAGVAAATLTAFYPDLVWFSAHFWSETLFLCLLWWAFASLLASEALAKSRQAALAGLFWGLAILSRETILYFSPLAALWLLLSRRPGAWLRSSFFLGVALLVVGPWTYRNWVVYHAFVPVSTSGGLNLWQGNARLSREEVYSEYKAVHGRVEQYRHARRKGLEAIIQRQPTWLFEKLVKEMPNFWEADSLVLDHIRIGGYGEVSTWAFAITATVVLAPYLIVLALFVRGLTNLSWERPLRLLLGFLAYYNLIHVVTHGFARYRLPVMPVLFVIAGSALASRREAIPARRKILAWGLALFMCLCLLPSLRHEARDLDLVSGSMEEPDPQP